jgi:hypothetical protein
MQLIWALIKNLQSRRSPVVLQKLLSGRLLPHRARRRRVQNNPSVPDLLKLLNSITRAAIARAYIRPEFSAAEADRRRRAS